MNGHLRHRGAESPAVLCFLIVFDFRLLIRFLEEQ